MVTAKPLIPSKRLTVARDGVEPSTPAFSGPDSLGLSPFSISDLIREEGHIIVTIL